MTDQTPRSGMPLLAAAQAQKHVTHNEALVQLDALLYARILDRDLTAPPASPADGDAYLVKATATGAWTGQGGKLAAALDGAWRFYPPFTGLSLYVADEQKLVVFDGTAWLDYAAILTLQNVPLLGVNTTADSTNRLAVKSAALLFDNAGAGVQARINKHAAADTASLLWQTSYSGRAELGLCGDDDFHLKVSPDGSSWTDALRISAANGAIGLGAASPLAPLHINTATSTAPTATLAGTSSVTLAAFTSEAGSSISFACFNRAGRFSMTGVRGRGTFASPAAVQANDRLFGFIAGGYDGAVLQNGASIEFLCDGTPSTGHVPARVSILTGTTSSDRTERVIVTSSGLVGIGGSPAVQLDVAGPVRVGQYTVATVPIATAGAGQLIYVSNESGGAVLAFSDGTNWRRVTDRAIVS